MTKLKERRRSFCLQFKLAALKHLDESKNVTKGEHEIIDTACKHKSNSSVSECLATQNDDKFCKRNNETRRSAGFTCVITSS